MIKTNCVKSKDSELIQKIYNGAGMGELKTVSDRDSMIGSLGDASSSMHIVHNKFFK